MEEAGFLDIQTPILFKPTPEGARDFVVPSRLQPGRFYALPQSPQILKQLTMVAGFDRYYQIAICFRDEDLRADRVQEITQLDVEMSFPDQELLFALMETMYARIWRECLGDRDRDAVPADDVGGGGSALRLGQAGHPLRAGARGRDRGDARLGVRRLRRSRGGALPPRPAGVQPRRAREARGGREGVGREGARLPRLRRAARSARRSRSSSRRPSSPRSAARTATTLLFAADDVGATSRVLGALRLHLGRELGLIDETRVHVPLGRPTSRCSSATRSEARWTAVHHPFTRPTDEWKERFDERARGRRSRTPTT